MKRSQIQIAIDKVNAEIAELGRVRDRLEAVAKEPKAKREKKAKTPKLLGVTQDGSMPERMRG